MGILDGKTPEEEYNYLFRQLKDRFPDFNDARIHAIMAQNGYVRENPRGTISQASKTQEKPSETKLNPKKNKYGNVKTEIDGILFDSKAEAERYGELKLMEYAGKITELSRQVKYILFPKNKHGREVSYIADFVYIDDSTGKMVVEDVKSKITKTPVYRLKKRLMAEIHNIDIREWEKGKANG